MHGFVMGGFFLIVSVTGAALLIDRDAARARAAAEAEVVVQAPVGAGERR